MMLDDFCSTNPRFAKALRDSLEWKGDVANRCAPRSPSTPKKEVSGKVVDADHFNLIERVRSELSVKERFAVSMGHRIPQSLNIQDRHDLATLGLAQIRSLNERYQWRRCFLPCPSKGTLCRPGECLNEECWPKVLGRTGERELSALDDWWIAAEAIEWIRLGEPSIIAALQARRKVDAEFREKLLTGSSISFQSVPWPSAAAKLEEILASGTLSAYGPDHDGHLDRYLASVWGRPHPQSHKPNKLFSSQYTVLRRGDIIAIRPATVCPNNHRTIIGSELRASNYVDELRKKNPIFDAELKMYISNRVSRYPIRPDGTPNSYDAERQYHYKWITNCLDKAVPEPDAYSKYGMGKFARSKEYCEWNRDHWKLLELPIPENGWPDLGSLPKEEILRHLGGWLTTGEALQWIMTRDIEHIAIAFYATPGEIAAAVVRRALAGVPGHYSMTIDGAKNALRRACSRGKVRATGVRKDIEEREEIPTFYWSEEIKDNGNRDFILQDFENMNFYINDLFTEFSSSDLLRSPLLKSGSDVNNTSVGLHVTSERPLSRSQQVAVHAGLPAAEAMANDCDGNTPSNSKTSPDPARSGRTRKKFYTRVACDCAVWLDRNGTPEVQAELEKYILEQVESLGENLSESQAREWAKDVIADHETRRERQPD